MTSTVAPLESPQNEKPRRKSLFQQLFGAEKRNSVIGLVPQSQANASNNTKKLDTFQMQVYKEFLTHCDVWKKTKRMHVKKLVRQGLPSELRGAIWFRISGAEKAKNMSKMTYQVRCCCCK